MKNKLAILFIFIIGLFFYLATIRGVSGNITGAMIKNNLDQATKPFELSPERGRFLLTMSLAQNRSFALSQELADAAYPDVGYKDGRFYIFFAPGISILAMPLYIVGTWFNLSQVFAYFTIVLFAIGNLILIYKISTSIFRLRMWMALMTVITFAFATTSWSYAITLYQHQVTAFFILSGFYATWLSRSRKASKIRWLFSFYVWFAYGASIFLDYPNVLLMAPVMVYHLFSQFQISKQNAKLAVRINPSYLITSVIFFFLIGLHGYYNYVNFGSPLRVSGSLVGYKTIKEKKIAQNKQGQELLNQLDSKKTIEGFFTEDQFPSGFSILTASRDRGILFYSPIIIFGILGILWSLSTITMELAILLALLCVNYFLYSSWGDPWGGWAYGPRYLIPTMAYLSIFVGLFFNKIKNKTGIIISKILLFIMFIFSSSVALLGALTTNAVPPKVEADYLKMKYNYLYNYDFLIGNRSGSFLYNEYVSRYVNLSQYFVLLLTILVVIMFAILFILPIIEKRK